MALFRRKPEPESPDELPSPGWQAIDDAMESLYGPQSPRHVGFFPPKALSNNLQGCSAYDAGSHWHFVTYGMSELYVPAPADDPKFSGWGFEFTFRVAKSGEADPPSWAYTLLNGLANKANAGGVFYQPGHRIELGRAITGYPSVEGAPPTELTVLAVTVDAELPARPTPNGELAFLQLVGVTAQDKSRMLDSSTAAVLAERRESNPLLVVTV